MNTNQKASPTEPQFYGGFEGKGYVSPDVLLDGRSGITSRVVLALAAKDASEGFEADDLLHRAAINCGRDQVLRIGAHYTIHIVSREEVE